MNGCGSAMRSPPMVVAPSAIASSIADCVFALERLISSSSTKFAWIGPICVLNRCVEKSKTWVPTKSDGMRSGVHCTRLKLPDTDVASVCAAVVLARPGTDSMRICPPETMVTISASRRLSWPTRVCANRARMRSASCRAWLRSSGDRPADVGVAGCCGIGVICCGMFGCGGKSAMVCSNDWWLVGLRPVDRNPVSQHSSGLGCLAYSRGVMVGAFGAGAAGVSARGTSGGIGLEAVGCS